MFGSNDAVEIFSLVYTDGEGTRAQRRTSVKRSVYAAMPPARKAATTGACVFARELVCDSKMVGDFHSDESCFCGSDLQIGSQVLSVQDDLRVAESPSTLLLLLFKEKSERT